MTVTDAPIVIRVDVIMLASYEDFSSTRRPFYTKATTENLDLILTYWKPQRVNTYISRANPQTRWAPNCVTVYTTCGRVSKNRWLCRSMVVHTGVILSCRKMHTLLYTGDILS